MRIFEKPNLSNNWKCPICEKSDEKSVVLIGIRGTEEENIMQAEQFHLDCLELRCDKKDNIIYQKFKENKK